MIITCTRRIQFCAGHRVFQHESKCKNPHGHNYVALIQATAPKLDTIGRVIDFSLLKTLMGGWIDEFWDHGFIWFKDDPLMNALYNEEMDGALLKTEKNFALPSNPTAENLAAFLVRGVAPCVMKGTGITINKVTLWETENCFAEAELD
jgi:6-pyruvoyltetrahydropterin/6-carboxytetrahydropterin synthase